MAVDYSSRNGGNGEIMDAEAITTPEEEFRLFKEKINAMKTELIREITRLVDGKYLNHLEHPHKEHGFKHNAYEICELSIPKDIPESTKWDIFPVAMDFKRKEKTSTGEEQYRHGNFVREIFYRGSDTQKKPSIYQLAISGRPGWAILLLDYFITEEKRALRTIGEEMGEEKSIWWYRKEWDRLSELLLSNLDEIRGGVERDESGDITKVNGVGGRLFVLHELYKKTKSLKPLETVADVGALEKGHADREQHSVS